MICASPPSWHPTSTTQAGVKDVQVAARRRYSRVRLHKRTMGDISEAPELKLKCLEDEVNTWKGKARVVQWYTALNIYKAGKVDQSSTSSLKNLLCLVVPPIQD